MYNYLDHVCRCHTFLVTSQHLVKKLVKKETSVSNVKGEVTFTTTNLQPNSQTQLSLTTTNLQPNS